jgi:hypothetical protein
MAQELGDESELGLCLEGVGYEGGELCRDGAVDMVDASEVLILWFGGRSIDLFRLWRRI